MLIAYTGNGYTTLPATITYYKKVNLSTKVLPSIDRVGKYSVPFFTFLSRKHIQLEK